MINLDVKTQIAIKWGAWAGILIGAFHKYVFADWQFLLSLLVIITVDTALGVIIAWKKKNISSERFARVIVKTLVYFLWLIATHVLTSLTVDGETFAVFIWVKYAVYSTIMLIEYISILENLIRLGVNVPEWIVSRLKNTKDDKENGK